MTARKVLTRNTLDIIGGNSEIILSSNDLSDISNFLNLTTTRVSNTALRGPASGIAAAPTFRFDVVADQPYVHFNHGFENRTDSSLTFNNSTRVFTIAPTSTQFNIWSAGTKVSYTTTQTIIISNTIGLHFIYFDASGVITESMTPWDTLGTQIFIATVYWNGTLSTINDERHNCTRNRDWHKWSHATIGTRYESGLTGTFTNTTFSFASGIIHDEDIILSITGPVTTGLAWYLNGITGLITFATTSTPYISSGGVLQYDNAGTLTNCSNNRYVINDIYATDDINNPIYIRISTNQYTSSALAQAAALNTWDNVSTAELKLLYRVIYRYLGGNITFDSSIDFRSGGTLPGGGSSATPAASVTYNPNSPLIATNVQSALDSLPTYFTQIGATFYIGTTLIANNRTSAFQTLTGINIDGSAVSAVTQSVGENTTLIATDAFVNSMIPCSLGDGFTVIFLYDGVKNIYKKDWQGIKLLFSTSRTNIQTYSRSFNNVAWTKLFAGTGSIPTVTPNFALGPDGITNCMRLQLDKGSGNTSGDYSLLTGQSIAIPASAYTGSIWMKSNDGLTHQVQLSITNIVSITVTVTTLWTEFTITGTALSTNGYPLRIGLRGTFSTDQTADILIDYAQLETGNISTSRITNVSSSTSFIDYVASNGYAIMNAAPLSTSMLFGVAPCISLGCRQRILQSDLNIPIGHSYIVTGPIETNGHIININNGNLGII